MALIPYEHARTDLGAWKLLLSSVYLDSQSPKARMKLSGVTAQARDLLEKYNLVVSRGGWLRVTGFTAWKQLQKQFDFCQNLRKLYEETLFVVEKTKHPATLFETSYDLFEMEPEIIKEAEAISPPSTMRIDESHWKAGFVAGMSVYRGYCSLVFKVRSLLFKVDELSLNTEQVVVSQHESKGLSVRQVTLSSYETWDEVDRRLKAREPESFIVELALDEYQKQHEEIASKLPRSLMSCSDKDCLKFLDWKVLGLNSPKLMLVSHTSYYLEDLALLCLPKVLSCHGPGYVEIWGLDIEYLPRVRDRVMEKHGCSLSDWKPSEEFFLSYSTPVHYLIVAPGDLGVLQGRKVYWFSANHHSCFSYWSFLPYNLSAFENALEVFNKNAQNKQPNAIPIHTLMLSLLSQEVAEINENLRLYLIQQVHCQLSNEMFFDGQAELKQSIEHFCGKCGCELLCVFYFCQTCGLGDRCKGCFEQEHVCETPNKFFNKFNEDEFFELLQNQITLEVSYEGLRLLKGVARAAKEDEIDLSEELLRKLEAISAPVEDAEVKEVRKKPKSSSSSSANEAMLVVSDSDFKLDPHKQKIKDALENPLTGPRFTFEFTPTIRTTEMKVTKSELKAELENLIYKKEANYFEQKTVDPKISEQNLSILVRKTISEELSKKKSQVVAEKPLTKMQFDRDELEFAIPRKKPKI